MAGFRLAKSINKCQLFDRKRWGDSGQLQLRIQDGGNKEETEQDSRMNVKRKASPTPKPERRQRLETDFKSAIWAKKETVRIGTFTSTAYYSSHLIFF